MNYYSVPSLSKNPIHFACIHLPHFCPFRKSYSFPPLTVFQEISFISPTYSLSGNLIHFHHLQPFRKSHSFSPHFQPFRKSHSVSPTSSLSGNLTSVLQGNPIHFNSLQSYRISDSLSSLLNFFPFFLAGGRELLLISPNYLIHSGTITNSHIKTQ